MLLVVTHAAIYYDLAANSSNPLVFGLVLALLVFIVLPLHATEVIYNPIALSYLLLFWPFLQIAQFMLVFQNLHTNYPININANPSYQLFLIINVFAIMILESNKRFWRPSTKLLFVYAKDSALSLKLNDPNLYEDLSYSWLTGLIIESYKKQSITEQDLPPNLFHISSKKLYAQLKMVWLKNLQQFNNTRSIKYILIRSLSQAFGKLIVLSICVDLLSTLNSFVGPQLLRLLIHFFTTAKTNDEPLLKGVLIVLSIFFNSCVSIYLNNLSATLWFDINISFKASLNNLLFDKSLRISPDGKSKFSSGEILNLISVDVGKLQSFALELSGSVLAPIQLVLCIASLWSILGKSSIVGLFTVLLAIPFNTRIVKFLTALNRTQMSFKDKRTKMTTEILTAIKSIKLYAWERPMYLRLNDLRNDEINNLKKIQSAYRIGNFFWGSSSLLVSFSSLAAFSILEKDPLTPELVFPSITLLNMLSRPLSVIPYFFNILAEASISVERISNLLSAPEIDSNYITYLPPKLGKDEETISIKNTSFLWSKPSDTSAIPSSQYALHDITFSALKGQLICIVGRVGSGKSSLLSALIGGLEAHNSTNTPNLTISGTISYASQTPWITNDTVKNNILFGHRFDQEFYNKTIEACQLIPDLRILPDGDETQVGEKGVSLSGGQKARLALARAVYTRSDIFLLDDVLSAVDSHVGKKIIENLLSDQGLLKDKTIILSTNSLLVLGYSDCIYFLEKGRIVETSTFEEARNQEKNPKLSELLSEFGKYDDDDDEETEEEETKLEEDNASPELESDLEVVPNQSPLNENEVLELVGSDELLDQSTPITSELRRASVATFTNNPFKEALPNLKTGPLKEVSAKGSIKWIIYWRYIKACSVWGWVGYVVFGIFISFIGIGRRFFLKTWAEKNLDAGTNNHALRFSSIYLLFGVVSSALNSVNLLLLYAVLGINGSKVIHEQMMKRVLRSPMRFFDRTPTGRIMNRFTNDMAKIDRAVPRVFRSFFEGVLDATINLMVIGIGLPPFLIVIVFMSIVYIYYQKYYVSISRELKRMASISSSPILAHLQESLVGVESIRAFNQFDRFEFINNANLDFNLKSQYMIRVVNRWLSIRLGFIGALIVLSTASLAIFSLTTSKPISPGTAGFLMSYAFQVTYSLSTLVKTSAEVEANVVAVERCIEYWDLPVEEEEEEEDKKPSKQLFKPPVSWPQSGSVKFDNYSTRYAKNFDLVLKNITLDIKSGEKIGVVGRTGAGKSSLTLALFRLIEPVDGQILVDDLSTTNMYLYDLRHNLGIIPQDAQLFDGSIRQNLDPVGFHTDEELWKALELAHLKDFVMELDRDDPKDTKATTDDEEPANKLECRVAEGGSNFSAGQRQLICLARALLSSSKILILDEATAAVDVQTDKVIQETIRSEFKDRTIIAIAHRLDTVMDSDRIVSLDHGEVKEFDTPENLLKKKDGIFYSLCKQGKFI